MDGLIDDQAVYEHLIWEYRNVFVVACSLIIIQVSGQSIGPSVCFAWDVS